MVAEYEKVTAIKIRLYKWKERMISEEFSDCGVLHCTIINETMHIKRQNKDFLEASRKCSIVPLKPLIKNLACSYKDSYQTWNRSWFSLLSGQGDRLMSLETTSWLSQTIAGYVTSNYHATRDTSQGGEKDFRIVVVVNVYMKTVMDECWKKDYGISLSRKALMYQELLHSDEYGLEQRRIISNVPDFLFEVEDKTKVLVEFLDSDRNSLLNGYASSGDENKIFCSIIDWVMKESHRLRLNPEQDSWYEEVKPAMKIKKFDASCSTQGEDICAICMDELRKGDTVVVTPCSHIFHCHSIVDWLAKEKMTCPICRMACPIML